MKNEKRFYGCSFSWKSLEAGFAGKFRILDNAAKGNAAIKPTMIGEVELLPPTWVG